MADLHADDIFGPLSKPMPAAVRAARQVIKGEAPDDELVNTDCALVAGFSLDHSERLRWDVIRQTWFVCHPDTHVWRADGTLAAPRMLQAWAEDRAFDAVTQATSQRDIVAIRAAVRRTLSAPKQRQLLELARHQELLAVAGDGWDTNPAVIATADGKLVDLQTGGIRDVLPDDYITQTCSVPIDTSARCDRWRKFITEICNDDASLEDLLTKAAGYSTTGHIGEQKFFAPIGPGSNGKSLFLETLCYVLNAYAGTLPFSTLTRERDPRAIQAEIADLPGTRFVRASELREGVFLDEGRIKALTGGDSITAAKKYQNPFSFRPTFKLWLASNHRPRVSDRSHGFWRRAVIIPFTRTFPGDQTLERILRDEAPGILAWLVEACLAWRQHGLPQAQAAEEARQAWREGEDLIAQWAHVALVADDAGRLGAADAFKAFTAWATSEGLTDRERPGRRSFGEWMTSNYRAAKTKTGKFYSVRLVTGDGCVASSGNFPPTRTHETTYVNEHRDPSPVTAGGADVDRL